MIIKEDVPIFCSVPKKLDKKLFGGTTFVILHLMSFHLGGVMPRRWRTKKS